MPSIILRVAWVLSLSAPALYAANLAYDDASDPAYGAGWTNGSNGGYGFAPWVIPYAGTNTLAFIQSSTVNGDGDSNADGDIDTAGVSWGLAGEFNTWMIAFRPFTGGPLAPGQSFGVSFDTGLDAIEEETGQGFALLDASLSEIYFSFYRATNSLTYLYTDASDNPIDSGIPVSDEGGRLVFTMVGPTSYVVTVSMLIGGTYTWSGSLSNVVEAFGVVRAFGTDFSDSSEPYRIFVNSLEIVPEARVFALSIAGAVALVFYRFIRSAKRN